MASLISRMKKACFTYFIQMKIVFIVFFFVFFFQFSTMANSSRAGRLTRKGFSRLRQLISPLLLQRQEV